MPDKDKNYIDPQIYGPRIYDRLRTRVIVLHDGNMLLLEPQKLSDGWRLPGGGLEPDESLKDCGEREVYEETGIQVEVTGIAFLREFVVPKYCTLIDGDERAGYSLEIYQYAHPLGKMIEPRIEDGQEAQMPHWIPLEDIPTLPLWPKELKTLAGLLLEGKAARSVPSFVSSLEPPEAEAPPDDIFT